jgi:hypothetical protein
LTPVVDGYINQIPSRLKYETKEKSLNAVNYNAVIASQGPDDHITKVWWMK